MHNTTWILAVVSIVLLCTGPFLPPYPNHIFIMIFLVSVCASGVWLMLRLGRLTVGQAAFMGLGAYGGALMATRLGVNPWLSILVGGLVAAILGMLIGAILLRLAGIYFALVTFGVAEITRVVLTRFSNITGGTAGLWGIPPLPSIGSKLGYYYLSLALMLGVIWLFYHLNRSRLGLALYSLGSDDTLADHMGVDPFKYRVLSFTLVCFFAGLSGAIFAFYARYITPDQFTLWEAIYMLIYVIIGGIPSVFGPFLGTAVMFGLTEGLRVSAELTPLIYGITLIAIVIFFQGGLVSIPQMLSRRFRPRARPFGFLTQLWQTLRKD
jgi:branched-chain amino acid transport system permease protein